LEGDEGATVHMAKRLTYRELAPVTQHVGRDVTSGWRIRIKTTYANLSGVGVGERMIEFDPTKLDRWSIKGLWIRENPSGEEVSSL
jgi:hypothetical protein